MFYVKGLLNVKTFKPSLWNIFALRYFLDRTFNWYVGGFYGYVPVIIFAIPGVLSFLDYGDQYNRLLLNWILVASAMIIVNFPWQARFLYLTPFNIYISLGILYGAKKLFNSSESKGQKPMATLIFWVFIILSNLLLLNYAVRCVTIKQFGPQGLTFTP